MPCVGLQILVDPLLAHEVVTECRTLANARERHQRRLDALVGRDIARADESAALARRTRLGLLIQQRFGHRKGMMIHACDVEIGMDSRHGVDQARFLRIQEQPQGAGKPDPQ